MPRSALRIGIIGDFKPNSHTHQAANAALHHAAARIVELPRHRFFMATLFLPQVTSTPEAPEPLIVGYLQAATEPQSASMDASRLRSAQQ